MNGNYKSKELAKLNSNESGGKRADLADGVHQSFYGSTQIRTAMLFVLTISVYALIAILLTTDMVLLREGKIILPFTQVGIPSVEFYVAAPALIAFLHINLLGRLILLAREIYKNDDDEESNDDAKSDDGEAHVNNKVRSGDKVSKDYGFFDMVLTMLFPTDPERLMSAMQEAAPATAFLGIRFFILVTAPLLVLLILQARFLAYQSGWVTLSHQIMVAFDLFFQFMFTLSCIKLWGKEEKLLHKLRHSITAGLVAIPAFYAWAVALVPDSYIENKVKSDWQQSIAGCFFRDWWKEEDKSFLCTIIKGERFINVPNTTISLQDVQLEAAGAFEETGVKPVPEVLCERIEMLDLSGRRLNYANFSDSRFKCVEMKGTKLHSSKLARAKFGITNLLRTDLSKADLSGADLSGADLSEADLSGADLSGADLSGADLSWADLSGADLSGIGLRRTRLWRADLSKADLSKADLSRADLSGANLLKADLMWANLSRTDLSEANLSEANLRWANLRGADLRWSDLKWSDLSGALLGLADLSEADLKWADLRWAHLVKANLSRANLYSTDLSLAKVYGATLYETKLRRTKLKGAKLYGANFSGSTPRDTFLGKVDGKKPKGWGNILVNIKYGLKEVGYQDGEINAQLTEIKRSGDSTLGYVPSTGTDHCKSTVRRAEWNSRAECAGIKIRR